MEHQKGGNSVLLIDTETSPNVGYTWGKYEQNVIKFLRYTDLLCISWKWLGEKQVYALGQCDSPKYRKGKLDDKWLVKEAWKLLERATIVIAHNGDRFDVRVMNARFIYHGLTPPTFYATIDTKKVAKQIGMFPSNKLDDLGDFLRAGRKEDTGGFKLWEECMAGDPSAWAKMKSYNKQDVILLERVYMKLRPWAKTHPNANVLQNTLMCCRICGSPNVVRRGVSMTTTGKRQNYQCKSCGAYSRGPHIPSGVVLR